MVKIPVSSPGQARVTTQGPVRRVSPGQFAAGAKDLQVVGKAVSEVAGMFERARRTEEKTRAQNQFLKRSKALDVQASTDQDFSAERQQFYTSELEKAKSEASSIMSLPVDRNAFALDVELQDQATRLSIQDSFRRKIIDNNKAQLEENLIELRDSYANSVKQNVKDAVKQARNEKLDEMVNAGVITRTDAALRKIKLDEQWKEFEFQNDIAFTSEETTQDKLDKIAFAEAKLSQGLYGFNAAQKSDALEVLEKTAKVVKKQDEVARQEVSDKNTGDFVGLVNENTTVSEILNFNGEQPVDPKVLASYLKAKTDEDNVIYESDKKIYVDLAKNITDIQDTRANLTQQMAKAVERGEIQFADAAQFKITLDRLFDKAEAFKAKPSKWQAALKGAVDSFEKLANFNSPLNPTDSTFSMIKELFGNIATNNLDENGIQQESERIIEAAQTVISPRIPTQEENVGFTNKKEGITEKGVKPSPVNIPSFNSSEEARASFEAGNIKSGQVISVQGKTFKVQ